MANINQTIANIKDAANTFVKYMNSNNLGPWDNSSVKAICSNINELAFEVRNKILDYITICKILNPIYFMDKILLMFLTWQD